ncbi:unnamed protein product [Protopolystoma xenopodis]|uniref:Uncharacterized protein n=1 Tax=Protopolystoma xenopodis TaxID=117903 RepID=A0A448WL81_9PLAT|nr:unnamed protein product [Protopolystoma xenopodis]
MSYSRLAVSSVGCFFPALALRRAINNHCIIAIFQSRRATAWWVDSQDPLFGRPDFICVFWSAHQRDICEPRIFHNIENEDRQHHRSQATRQRLASNETSSIHPVNSTCDEPKLVSIIWRQGPIKENHLKPTMTSKSFRHATDSLVSLALRFSEDEVVSQLVGSLGDQNYPFH